jgi:hypothetical protein
MAMMDDDYIFIGKRHQWGEQEPQPFGLRNVDRRQHVYVIGKTGSGKPTLLRNMIVQHIALGHGVGLIDPHGDLAEEVLHHIPPKRADDLVYFNPADLDHPIGLNVLARVPTDERPLIVSGIIAALKSLWRDSWGPRMEYILHSLAFACLFPDEKIPSALEALRQAVAFYKDHRIQIQRLLTDRGSTYRAKLFAATCQQLGIKHRFTRPYRPQTNGKAERFIQTITREGAYGRPYDSSIHRAGFLPHYLHDYNFHRPHSALHSLTPSSRLSLTADNVSSRNS